MSRATRKTPPVEPPALTVDEAPRLGEFSPHALVELLLSEAGPKLGRADLQAIVTGGAEFGENAAGFAARVADGLGCLIASDASGLGGGVGSFRDGHRVAELVWHMKAHFEALEAMASAVGWAASELAARDER